MFKYLFFALINLVFFHPVSAQPPNTCTTDWLRKQLYIREATGNNDGPDVAWLIRGGGGDWKQRPQYCGFTQAFAQHICGLPIPANGMQGAAAAWFRDPLRTVYLAGQRGTVSDIQVSHKLGFSYGHGIHHIGACVEIVPPLRKGRPPRGFYSIAGNEGRGPTAGVHLTFYPATSIAAASDWSK